MAQQIYKSIFSLILLLGFVSITQFGCTNSKEFSDSGSDLLNKQLGAVEMTDEDEAALGLDEYDQDDAGDEGSADEEVGDVATDKKCNSKGKCDKEAPGNGPKVIDGSGQYICILEGSGKSIRLGLVDNVAGGQHKIPSVICMTENACLNEVSRSFDVKMAHKRGFCPNKNPHAIGLSDEQVKDMIDAM